MRAVFVPGLLALPVAFLVGCDPQPGPGPALAPHAAPASATPTGPTAGAGSRRAITQPAAPPSSPPASAAECTRNEACSGADAAPPPLRAGKGGAGPFADSHDATAKSAEPCTRDTLKKQLQGIVDACRRSSPSICGDLVLHTAAGDAGSDDVSVDFNLGTSGNTEGFSKCVVGRINSVTWECAAPGGDIRLDLGCRL